MMAHGTLDDFANYLIKNRLARPSHVPFLVRRVGQYLAAPVQPGLCPEDTLRVFLEALPRLPGIQEWQVCQAGDAVWSPLDAAVS